MRRTSAPPPWSRTSEVLLVVGFWVLLGALALVRRSLDPRGPVATSTASLIVTLAEYGLWSLITLGVFAVTERFPMASGVRVRRALLYLGVVLVAAIAVEWARQSLFAAFFPEEILERRFRRRGGPRQWEPGLEGIITRLRFVDEMVISVAILAAGFARDALARLRERETHTARLEAQLADARLSALRMQLNPHFLFNTLHAVSALVERDPAGVRTMIARLSSLLRRVLDGGDRHEVTLRDELAFLRDYLDVQRVRFQGRLDVEEHIEDGTLDALVPNLVLQPLAENAVQHGVSRREDAGGRIVVSAQREGGSLVLTVRDNGPGPSAEARGGATDDSASGATGTAPRSGGLGLRNTRQRLDALYGRAASLELGAGADGGAEARVMLPFHTADDLVLHG
ncbi:sensor histidine kinase [Rubricoccus marinus]|uniref:Histidine kinase domain-containing protein n=1 Tax=Rubricoccus marinus TaxID=716817 RepID=A0A259U0S8_9BACT|nr:histidine kinase [Rubricoccus marinus]OZC03602.1 hypothetical protein BSZ36_11775 [Rubricoccus marinus]